MTFRTTLREIRSSRQISLIALPCEKYARRILAIVSTTSIPIEAPNRVGGQSGPVATGSRLDAHQPHSGVPIRPRPRKKVEQAAAVSTLDHMLGKLLAARTVDRHNPFLFAQFERGEQRDIIRAGGGRDSGRGGDGLHRLPPCWCGSSAYQVGPPSTRIGSFSALLTLWLSMIAAVGLASRAAASRHFTSSASWMRSSVPSQLQRS